ncbi:Eco57I restriction-modification methylase domain-containing protein [Streptomyces prunicolor]|uniref:Eco57I restriction-modification methylase domain-containing protein n=1 Tax=Streptomyces prunicolor TaxID=67348 RepID=UPI0033ECCD13
MGLLDGTPAQHGHAGFPTAADHPAIRLVERLARGVGHQAAVAWVHTGAVLWWADTQQLTPGAVPFGAAQGMRDGLKRLADVHPSLAAFTDPAANALWQQSIGDDDAAAIRDLWADRHVADPHCRPHGYLLGNAYQALSEESRKHRALAQTPRYITDLLMDLAFRSAADEHGMDGLKMIDPSCGTGHILYEALSQAQIWKPGRRRSERCMRPGERLERALHMVHGVDLDPYAVLIASLRLVAAASQYLRVNRDDHPSLPEAMPADWPVNVAAADALLDSSEPLLQRGRYHVVVGNPPYITPKTAEQRDAVRAAYPLVCHGKYALSLPFHQLMTELLVPGGWCAQLTANSFMKREFGKRFIEKYLATQDLRWVIDTSGAYIPGHGTPTVILVHRNQAPIGDTVAAVMGIRGEPSAPTDPSRGVVWGEIEQQVRQKLAFQRLASTAEPGEGDVPALRLTEPNPQIAEQLDLFADSLDPAA